MKSWKTTLVGLLAAVWFAIQPIIAHGDFVIERDYRSLIYAAIFAAFGFFTKDSNVTGGTVINSPSTAKVVDKTTKTDS